MSTRGILFLTNAKIPHEVRRYEHLEKGAVFASQALGTPLEATIKTLVMDLTPGGPVYLLMPGNREVPLKELARKLGVRKAAMAEVATAEKLSGYLVGGISPFGVRKRLPVHIEGSLMHFDRVAINAGQRGMMVILSPQDIVKAVNAQVIELF